MRKVVLFPEVLWFQEGPGVRNNQYKKEGIKLLNVANFIDGNIDLSNTDRYISEEEAYGKYKHFLVDKNDFIIASSGIKVEYFDTKMGFAKEEHLPLCMNTSTIRFKVLDENILNIRYFMYFLKSNKFKEQLFREITGSAQLNFGPSHLKKMKLTLISLDEQKRIANILDKVTELIQKRKKQLDKLDLLVKAKFVEMFGDPVKNEKGWEVILLFDVTNKIASGATPKGGKQSYISKGISLIRSMNVYDGIFQYKELAHITEEQAKQLENVIIEKDDVLINITGASVTRCCIVPCEILPARVNQHVMIVRCLKGILNNIFLNYQFINVSYKNKLIHIAEASGATRQALTKQQIENLKIIVPPIELQEQFAKFVEQTEKSKIKVNESLEKLETLKKALMQQYFN